MTHDGDICGRRPLGGLPDRSLASAVRPPLSEALLARQWDGIRQRLRPRRRTSRALIGVGAAVAMAVAVAIFVPFRTPADSPWDGAIVESTAEPVTVTLKDGSRIDLERRSRLEVVEKSARSIQFRVRAGHARFDVAPDRNRRFSVLAENVAVHVVGTRFAVALEPAPDGGRRVSVAVEKGIVEVHAEQGTVRLRAGQTWSTGVEADPQTEKPSKVTTPAEPSDQPSKPSTAVADAPKSARDLFEAANQARLEGNAAGAADNYRALLTQYPSDARAGLAAFELGRLLQDRLGDPSGAAQALSRAVRLASGSEFREDAMARLVRAYATMGADSACERARDAYLESYPSGVHATAIRRSCGER